MGEPVRSAPRRTHGGSGPGVQPPAPEEAARGRHHERGVRCDAFVPLTSQHRYVDWFLKGFGGALVGDGPEVYARRTRSGAVQRWSHGRPCSKHSKTHEGERVGDGHVGAAVWQPRRTHPVDAEDAVRAPDLARAGDPPTRSGGIAANGPEWPPAAPRPARSKRPQSTSALC